MGPGRLVAVREPRDAATMLAGCEGSRYGDALLAELADLRRSVIAMAHVHLAYPVLHYFHSSERRDAFGPNLAALYDAVATLEASSGPWSDRVALAHTRRTIEEFLDPLLLDHDTIHQPPPLPTVPGGPGPEGRRRLEDDLAHHRRKLAALVYEEGWTWWYPPVPAASRST